MFSWYSFQTFSLSFSLLFQWLQLFLVQSYISGSKFAVSLYINCCILTSFQLHYYYYYYYYYYHYYLYNSLTYYSKVQSLSSAANWFKLVKKFPKFHGTRRFITALTSVRHLPRSWASPIKSIYPHPTSWKFILILSTHLRLGLCMLRDVSPRNTPPRPEIRVGE